MSFFSIVSSIHIFNSTLKGSWCGYWQLLSLCWLLRVYVQATNTDMWPLPTPLLFELDSSHMKTAAQPFHLSRLCSINPSELYCFCPLFQNASSMAIQIFMKCSCTKYAVCLAVKTMRKFCVNFHVVSAKWKPLPPSVCLPLSPSSSFFPHSCH